MADFFEEGLPLVEAQPESTVWFAFRLNETTYGAFTALAEASDGVAFNFNAGGVRPLPPYSLEENMAVFPRAFVVPRAEALPARTQVLEAKRATEEGRKAQRSGV